MSIAKLFLRFKGFSWNYMIHIGSTHVAFIWNIINIIKQCFKENVRVFCTLFSRKLSFWHRKELCVFFTATFIAISGFINILIKFRRQYRRYWTLGRRRLTVKIQYDIYRRPNVQYLRYWRLSLIFKNIWTYYFFYFD